VNKKAHVNDNQNDRSHESQCAAGYIINRFFLKFQHKSSILCFVPLFLYYGIIHIQPEMKLLNFQFVDPVLLFVPLIFIVISEKLSKGRNIKDSLMIHRKFSLIFKLNIGISSVLIIIFCVVGDINPLEGAFILAVVALGVFFVRRESIIKVYFSLMFNLVFAVSAFAFFNHILMSMGSL
jgi:hypothetical protein